MNLANYNKLKPKYKNLYGLITMSAVLASAYPIWKFAFILAIYMGLDPNSSMKEQDNGDLWFFGFIVFSAFSVIASATVISYVIALYKGWSLQQTLDYFVRYENFPEHWVDK